MLSRSVLNRVYAVLKENTFQWISTEVVVVGFTERITGGSLGTAKKDILLFHSSVILRFVIHCLLSVLHPFYCLLPSCRVVTESVSLLKRLSPTSLVATIRNLYEVKGFSLQTQIHYLRNDF